MNVVLSAAVWTGAVLALAALLLTVYLFLVNYSHHVVLHVRRSEHSLIQQQVSETGHLAHVRIWIRSTAVAALVCGLVALGVYIAMQLAAGGD